MAFNPGDELLSRHMAEHGEKVALLFEDRSLSYAELYRDVKRYAGILQTHKGVPGDRVVIALPDSPEFVCAFFGSIVAGLVPVPCSDLLDRENLEFLLGNCRASTLFGRSGSAAAEAVSPHLQQTFLVDSPEFLRSLDQALAHYHPQSVLSDAVCFLLYTSGSTGIPKEIAHRGTMLLPEADTFGREILKVTPDDILFSASKMHFGFGLLNSIVHGLGAGATVALMSGKPTLSLLRRVIEKHRPTLFFAVPAVYNLLLDGADTLCNTAPLRLCVSSGEMLERDLCLAWQERTGVALIDSAGTTETFHAFIANRPDRVVPGAAGWIIPPWEARIVAETGSEVPDGTTGHLEVRGYSILDPSATENRGAAGGWLKTGDMYQARDGLFTFVGRANDMFKCDGNWVSPLPIESALRMHPAVEECAVCSRRILEADHPVAHIVLRQGFHQSMALERTLFAFLQARLPKYMCPIQYVFHPELPKTITGKIRRRQLDTCDPAR